MRIYQMYLILPCCIDHSKAHKFIWSCRSITRHSGEERKEERKKADSVKNGEKPLMSGFRELRIENNCFFCVAAQHRNLKWSPLPPNFNVVGFLFSILCSWWWRFMSILLFGNALYCGHGKTRRKRKVKNKSEAADTISTGNRGTAHKKKSTKKNQHTLLERLSKSSYGVSLEGGCWHESGCTVFFAHQFQIKAPHHVEGFSSEVHSSAHWLFCSTRPMFVYCTDDTLFLFYLDIFFFYCQSSTFVFI